MRKFFTHHGYSMLSKTFQVVVFSLFVIFCLFWQMSRLWGHVDFIGLTETLELMHMDQVKELERVKTDSEYRFQRNDPHRDNNKNDNSSSENRREYDSTSK